MSINIPAQEQIIQWSQRMPRRIRCVNSSDCEQTHYLRSRVVIKYGSGTRWFEDEETPLKKVRPIANPSAITVFEEEGKLVLHNPYNSIDDITGARKQGRPISFKCANGREWKEYFLNWEEVEHLLGRDFVRYESSNPGLENLVLLRAAEHVFDLDPKHELSNAYTIGDPQNLGIETNYKTTRQEINPNVFQPTVHVFPVQYFRIDPRDHDRLY